MCHWNENERVLYKLYLLICKIFGYFNQQGTVQEINFVTG